MRPIAITMGDAAGDGPEIVARLFRDGLADDCVVLGCAAVMARAAALVGAPPVVPISRIDDRRSAGTMPVLPAGAAIAPPPYGVVSAEAGAAAHAAILAGADLAMAGAAAALVTAPIHKEALAAAGVPHPGHTEILAQRAGVGEAGMMLANDELRVMLVSIHVALREAIERLSTGAVLLAIERAEAGARMFGVARPRIAVAGLNPHAGEGGLFGDEESRIIAPAIAAARAAGLDASGPHPPDTVFMRARRGAFDIVVAMHHDQGLIPVKYLGVEAGVNVTVGLPFVRTSPDHGTAFDIAGKGLADASGIAYAVKIARTMAAATATSGSGEAR
jgi:4-hydroxythreonine-4-phosphate dehydrogenase